MHPILPLAISMDSNKGVYALLLGSGVSHAAQIPTGHEINVDLIRKVAHLQGEYCDPDPIAWYTHRTQQPPNYSKLLSTVAKSAAERSALLRGYFEPSGEERERGEKIPTDAHEAIARLVASEHIRVIITTNFDRLLEQALEAEGIVPTVISTASAAEGALPLAHVRCAIIKVHGDYLDPNIRNTEEELATYQPPMNRLLDRVFDEYGLIVCGWSAEWDTAMCAALERCKSRRFTTYWTARTEPRNAAQRLIAHRSAEKIHVASADQFFTQLAEHIASLEELSRPHPLSAKLARAAVKRYVVNDAYRIHLHDLVMDEANRVHEELTHPLKGGYAVPNLAEVTPDELEKRMRGYETLSEVLCSIFATGCYWGERQHHGYWSAGLERLSNLPDVGRTDTWGNLRYYPALLALYAGGMAAITANRYDTLAALFISPKVNRRHDKHPLILAVNPYYVLNNDNAVTLSDCRYQRVAFSQYLYLSAPLRELLREFLPRDDQHQHCFDSFEYFLGLVHMDLRQQAGGPRWGPVGMFAGRGPGVLSFPLSASVDQEIERLGSDWPPLKAGLFGGSIERFRSVKAEFDALARRILPS